MGNKLGRYEILKGLAHGDMAELWLARATGMEGFENHVVIKKLRDEHALDRGVLEMFVAEARLAATLHHHNIVQVRDIGEQDGTCFFAMEYVHGEDLRRLLTRAHERNEHVPLAQVVSIGVSVATALHHAHEQKGSDDKALEIVHRDVSPSNILLGYDGNVKVVDFGIARATLRTAQTQTAMLKGKAPYMSPEQCSGKKLDRRSDVFSLGIVLYELATRRRLFKASNEYLTMSAIVACKVPRPSVYRPDLPKQLDEIILRALAHEPAARYQTAGQLLEALDAAAIELDLRSSNNALAGYLKQMFGERPEPWTVADGLQPPVHVDFDGRGTGIAAPPAEALKPAPLAKAGSPKGSPIEAARAAVAGPAVETARPAPVKIPDGAPAPAPAAGKRKKAATRGPVPVPSRPRPKTVQIPVTRGDPTLAGVGIVVPPGKVVAPARAVAVVEASPTVVEASPMVVEASPTVVEASPLLDLPTAVEPPLVIEASVVVRPSLVMDVPVVDAPPVVEAPVLAVAPIVAKAPVASTMSPTALVQRPAEADEPTVASPSLFVVEPTSEAPIASMTEPLASVMGHFTSAIEPPASAPPKRRSDTEPVSPLPSPGQSALLFEDAANDGFAMAPVSTRRRWLPYAIAGGVAFVLILVVAIGRSAGGGDEAVAAAEPPAVATRAPVPRMDLPAAPAPAAPPVRDPEPAAPPDEAIIATPAPTPTPRPAAQVKMRPAVRPVQPAATIATRPADKPTPVVKVARPIAKVAATKPATNPGLPATAKIATKPAPATAKIATKPAPATAKIATKPAPATAKIAAKPVPATAKIAAKPAPATAKIAVKPAPATAKIGAKPTPATAKIATKPTPANVAAKPAPTKPAPGPAKTAAKPTAAKPATKPATKLTTKPTKPGWDANSLFPK